MLGFVSAILPGRDLAGVLKVAAELRYDCVELMCWPPGAADDRRYADVVHLNAAHFTAADAAETAAQAADAGVSLSGLGYYPNPLDPDPAVSGPAIEHLAKLIDAAALLAEADADAFAAGPVVNTFAGRDPAQRVDENWPRFLEVFAPLVARAADRGVKLAIENCPMLFGADEWPGGKNLAFSPAIWRRMFADLPDPCFGLNYDPSHLTWMRLDPLTPLRQFADRLHHVHAKDVRVDAAPLAEHTPLADPELSHTPTLPGFGDVDWGRFAGLLYEVGYRGPVCVEVEDRAFEGSEADVLRALAISRDVLRPFWPRP